MKNIHCRTPTFKTREWEALATNASWYILLDTIDDEEHKQKEGKKIDKRDKINAKNKSTTTKPRKSKKAKISTKSI